MVTSSFLSGDGRLGGRHLSWNTARAPGGPRRRIKGRAKTSKLPPGCVAQTRPQGQWPSAGVWTAHRARQCTAPGRRVSGNRRALLSAPRARVPVGSRMEYPSPARVTAQDEPLARPIARPRRPPPFRDDFSSSPGDSTECFLICPARSSAFRIRRSALGVRRRIARGEVAGDPRVPPRGRIAQPYVAFEIDQCGDDARKMEIESKSAWRQLGEGPQSRVFVMVIESRRGAESVLAQ